MKKPPTISKALALQELARRKGLIASPGTFRLEDYLFDKQLAFVRDPSPFKVAVTTRRAGKTISCVADLLHTAVVAEGSINLYITLSRKNAKRLVWPELKRLNSRFGLGGEANESDLSMHFPNGSFIYILGAADRGSIEDFRGLAIKKVYLDEAQSFPEYIRELIDDVLGPALMDYAGQLILIGTPGPVPTGYFFDLRDNTGWAHHAWTYWDNPKLDFLKTGLSHQDMLDRELKRRGVAPDDPSIQREWFGKWVVDENSLVYHWSKPINHYDKLPLLKWHYIIGLDLGFDDADAIALLAYSEGSPATYLVEERVTRGQDISQLAAQVQSICDKYPVDKIVVDTGGLGKKITEEISKRFSIPMVAAEKNRKNEYIELMNDAMRTGKLFIKDGSQFAQDSLKVEWDHDHSTPDRKVIAKRFHSDIADAVLYAWRESYSYTYVKPIEEPEYGTKPWGDKLANDMFEAELERLEEAKEPLQSLEDAWREQHDPREMVDKLQRLDRPKLRYQALFDKKKGQ